MTMIFKYSLTMLILLCPLLATGQSLTMTKSVRGVRTTVWKAASSSEGLPSAVDNSTSIHFPPVFEQIGGSCAQASTIGYVFTYEMNALLNRDASMVENRFSYLYTWNLVNGGEDVGSFQMDGMEMATSSGIMTEADFPAQRYAYEFKWASGFDKYLDAMHYKGKKFVSITITDEASLNNVKQYLYNKGEEGGKGGILSFSSQASGWRFDSNYTGPSATGYTCLLTSLATSGAHAMTIVGYDDLVESKGADGSISKGAFIAVNSYGEYFHDRGRYYLPYRFFLEEHSQTALDNDLMGIVPEYVEHPEIVFKVALDYNSRDDLSFRFGVSPNSTDLMPKHDYKFPLFDHQGGEYPMQGRGAGTYFEFGMDFSTYASRADESDTPNWFLTVRMAQRGSKLGEGVMRAFEVYDYRENPASPKIYRHTKINGKALSRGDNIFNIPSVPPDSCSYSPIQWLNISGKPVAAPVVFRTADGKYAKVRFSEYDRESGTIKVRYVYAPDGRTNLE